MNQLDNHITNESRVRNGTFTDYAGNASTEHWKTNAASVPVRIPGGKHTLSLNARDFITQELEQVTEQNFKVHYAFKAAASHPSPNTYIRVRVEDERLKEEVDIVVNNKVLHERSHTGIWTFSANSGPLKFTFSNEVLNSGRFIELTDISLWIEAVDE